MKKCAMLFLVAMAAAGASSSSQLTDGWSPVDPKFKVQWPYDLQRSDRYQLHDGTYHLWVFNTDKPFSKGNKTRPRTEMRFPDYSGGQQQFEADMMSSSGTNNVCIMQIHTSDAESPNFGATDFMLDVRNGSLKHYDDKVLAPDMLDKWFHLNVIHDLSSHRVTAYIDGKEVFSGHDDGAKRFYFKCGVYEQRNGSHEMQVFIKNIKLWSKP